MSGEAKKPNRDKSKRSKKECFEKKVVPGFEPWRSFSQKLAHGMVGGWPVRIERPGIDLILLKELQL